MGSWGSRGTPRPCNVAIRELQQSSCRTVASASIQTVGVYRGGGTLYLITPALSTAQHTGRELPRCTSALQHRRNLSSTTAIRARRPAARQYQHSRTSALLGVHHVRASLLEVQLADTNTVGD
eukprot:6666179-Pyramimonas_sp.AAC.1